MTGYLEVLFEEATTNTVTTSALLGCRTRDQSLFVNLTFCQKHVKRQKQGL